MNLIIFGDNPQHLAKVEALARELGLSVNRELGKAAKIPSKRGNRMSQAERQVEGEFPHLSEGPSYGIE